MNNFFYSNIILVPLISFAVGTFLKMIYFVVKTGKINFSKALSSGGMPSVHSILVTSLTTAIALKHGVNSTLFAISLVFTVVVLYDAMNIRFQAGLHAKTLNKNFGTKFNELLGHFPSEVFAGSFLGIIVAQILYYI